MRGWLLTICFMLACTTRCGSPSEGNEAEAYRSVPQGGPVQSAKVFFFGHSLVDQDMPSMLGSLATAAGKQYAANGQLGFGTPLEAHVDWDGDFDEAPLGFDVENRGHTFFAGEGKAQLRTGQYDVLVLTESNGHTRGNGDETVESAAKLIALARKHNPKLRAFLYSSWLDRREFADDAAWRAKTEADLAWWEAVARRTSRAIGGAPVYVIPGSVVLARITRAIEKGEIPGLSVNALFLPDDGVHPNDLGFYVIALAHYAAIFRDSPLGLPAATQTEDGPATPFSEAQARALQERVWSFMKAYPRAGIAP